MTPNLRLLYIVNVNVGDATARSVQVAANAFCFQQKLGAAFKLISPQTDTYKHPNSRYVFGIRRESSVVRKIVFHARICLDILLAPKSTIIYSRNVTIIALASLLGRPSVWEIHDRVSGINAKLYRKLQGPNIRVVAISDALRKYLANEFSCRNSDILVAHDGVFVGSYLSALNSIDISDVKQQFGISQERFVLMHSGSLYAGRGMEIFRQIAERFPTIQLVQVGGQRSDIKYWKSVYSKFSNVIFIPHQKNRDLINLHLVADAFLLPMTKKNPIWWCTSPMKLFEYMAACAPILHTNIGSISEVLGSSNSISFDLSSADSLTDALNYIMSNPEACKKLAQRAYTECVQGYDWSIRIDNILTFCGLEQQS